MFLFDCETTGLSDNDSIIELTIQVYDPEQALDSMQPFSTLVNPNDVPCSPAARSVRSITDEELCTADVFSDSWRRVTEYMNERTDFQTEVPIIVAYNAAFDASHLRCELERHGVPFPEHLRLSCLRELTRKY